MPRLVMPVTGSAAPRFHHPALVLTALVLVAVNLRPAITAIGPVSDAMRADLGISRALTGLLTSGPVLCMGLFAPFAGALAARFGVERTVAACLALVGIATALRLVPGGFSLLFVTAVAAGLGVAVAGPLLSAFVKQRFPARAAPVMGVLSMGLTMGAALAAGASAPLQALTGSWRIALGIWALVAVVALGAWRIAAAAPASAVAPVRAPLPWRRPRAWLLIAYFGLQSSLYYAIMAWLAPRYTELGRNAAFSGALVTAVAIAQTAASLGIPLLAARSLDRRPWLVLCALLVAAGLGAVAWFPLAAPWLWAAILGVGTGGLFALGLTLPLDDADTSEEAGALTAMTLSGGYLIASAGPFAVGALRDASGSYRGAFAWLMAVGVAVAVLALWLGPRRRPAGIPNPRPEKP